MRRAIRVARNVILLAIAIPSMAFGVCPGDCDDSGAVSVDELVRGISIALGTMNMQSCPNADQSGDHVVTVDEITMAVAASINGCGGSCGGSAGTSFPSTFAAIQKDIFDRYGCNAQFCHSHTNPANGLDLSTAAAYESLLGADGQGAPSAYGSIRRVLPGDKDRSLLYLKLAAKTDPTLIPEHVEVPGSPMPNNQFQLTKDELEAVRLWIYAGASETAVVNGTQNLLDACLPDPKPIIIEPLPAPPAGTGVQFEMPPWDLPAKTEYELCFATYYDITDQVPKEFQDPTGQYFRFSGQELRQDPQSHHLILNLSSVPVAQIHDPAFGQWTCTGGATPGAVCEPTDLKSCGTGICTSDIQHDFACVGFGPRVGTLLPNAIGGAQKAQSNQEYAQGVFAQIPMKGILYWNSHAFNLTNEPTTMHARLNYYFAGEQKYPLFGIFNTSRIFAANAPPYTTQEVCNDSPVPPGTQLFSLSSHTHKRGKDFRIFGPNDELLYENFIYNDPPNKVFDPPISYPDGATLRYCSLYNNGVGEDGSPDPETVTRRSRTPESARESIGLCRPTACAAGKIGAPCNFKSDEEPDNHACDTSEGSNNGLCDACRITGGESTENEMFILIGSYYIDFTTSAAAAAAGEAAGMAIDESGRSTYTGLALPPVTSCGSSHMGHAGH